MILLGNKRISLVTFRLQTRTRVNSQYNNTIIFTKRTQAINTSASRFQQKTQQEQEKEQFFTGKIFTSLTTKLFE